MKSFLLIFIPLSLYFFENVKSEDNFEEFTYHEYRRMSQIKEWVDSIWKSSWNDFRDDAARKDFEMILCDKPESNAYTFYERFINGHTVPEVMNGEELWESKEFLDKNMTVQRTLNSLGDYHVDVMKNGKRIGLEFWPTTKWFFGRTFQLRRAIIYTCEEDYGVTFRDYAPTLKAQKLFNRLYYLGQIKRFFQGEREHFSMDYFTFDTCTQKIAYTGYNAMKYLMVQFLKEENYLKQAKVMDAYVIKGISQKWQASVKWGEKNLQFQLEDVGDKVVITMGREWPCEASWK